MKSIVKVEVTTVKEASIAHKVSKYTVYRRISMGEWGSLKPCAGLPLLVLIPLEVIERTQMPLIPA